MKNIITTLSLIICLAILNTNIASSGVPQTINYRGRLVDASGAPVVDGANFITFSIYGVPTGGTTLWTSGIQAVTSSGGLFNYELGSNVALPTGLFSDNAALYLGIQIGVDAEIAPRTKFGSSAFALQADHADFAAEAITAGSADIAIEAQRLGNQAPAYYLDWNNLTGLPAGFADGVDNVDTDWNSLTNVPAGFADGVDNGGSGDITGVTAAGGLTGGGTTGDVTIGVADGGITSQHIAPGSVGSQQIDPTGIQVRVTGAAGAGQAISGIGSDGSVTTVNVGAGDITGVTASGGLTGGGTTGAVTVQVAPNGITAAHIASGAVGADEIAVGAVGAAEIATGAVNSTRVLDNSLLAEDLAPGCVGTSEIADGSIAEQDLSFTPGDITGVTAGAGLSGGGTLGAVSLSLAPTISQAETFTNTVKLNGTTYFGDSTLRVASSGIKIGDHGVPFTHSLVHLQRFYSTASVKSALRVGSIVNKGNGVLYGVNAEIGANTGQGDGNLYAVFAQAGLSGPVGPGGHSYGLRVSAYNRNSSTTNRYGVYSMSGGNGNTGGTSYGIYSASFGGVGSTVFALYASAGGPSTSRYAGYFLGNVNVAGTLSKSAGSFKIDHPLFPDSKYLQHSFVESPDMMNVYNGNVITDASGNAIVTLPAYFETLNKDFRYQLTVVGVFAQAIVSQKVSGNQFSIMTDKPNVEVSWQVTGVRQDAYANAHRIQVEVDKPVKERGLYLHPVARGLSETLQLHYEQNKKAQEKPADTRGQ